MVYCEGPLSESYLITAFKEQLSFKLKVGKLPLPYIQNLCCSFELHWQIDTKSVNGREYRTMSSFNANERWTWYESSVRNDIYVQKNS